MSPGPDSPTSSRAPAGSGPGFQALTWLAGALATAGILGLGWWALRPPAGLEEPGPLAPVTETPNAAAQGVLPNDLPPLAWDPARLQARRRAESALLEPALTERDRALLAERGANNLVQGLAALERFDGDAEPILNQWRESVHDYVRLHGVERYRALSWIAWEVFSARLHDLLVIAGQRGGIDAVLADPTDEVVRGYLEGCGDFVLLARQTGVVSDDGQLHLPPDFLSLLFRYQWMSEIRELFPVDASVPGDELRAFQRWRFDDAEGIDAQTRVRLYDSYVTSFGPLDERPPAFWRAVLWNREGFADQAQAELRALAATDPTYRPFLLESTAP